LEAQNAPDTSKKPVKVRTVAVNLPALQQGKHYHDTIFLPLNKFHYWDEADTLTGFTQTLGQVGKPYRQYQFGLPTYYLSRNEYRDPLTREPNVYLWDLNNFLPIYDTRTPYINLDFAQSAYETQLLRVLFSQNITSLWNTGVYYRRRSSIGPYANFTTDQFNIAMGHHFHSFDNKFHLVVGGAYQYLSDLINGGTFQDGTIPYAQSFQGPAQRVRFTGNAPRLLRRARNVMAYGSYQLRSDSSAWGLGVHGAICWDDYWKLYLDPTRYDSVTVLNSFNQKYFPYANWYQNGQELSANDLLFNLFTPIRIGEGIFVQRLNAWGGLRARVSVLGNSLNLQYRLGYERIRVNESGTSPNLLTFKEQNKNSHQINGEISLLKGLLTLRNETKFTFNNLFSPELFFYLNGTLRFGVKEHIIRDSSVIDTSNRRKAVRQPFVMHTQYVPFLLETNYRLNSQNPTLFQSFWHGLTFQGKNNLFNESANIFTVRGRYSSKIYSKKGLPYRENFAQVESWLTNISSVIYTDQDARVLQGGHFRSLGVSVSGSFRWKRFYVDGLASVQTLNADYSRLQQSQPQWWGNVGLSYENRIAKTGLVLMLSVRSHFFAGFQAYAFEPSTQLFYPQTSYQVPTYARFDVIAAGKVGQRTQIFIKFIHLNEGVVTAGYYTTPFYPMLGRVLSFGINWSFYD
jgi:hypothetical protein